MGQCQSGGRSADGAGTGPSGAKNPAELLNLGPRAEAYFATTGRSFYDEVRAPPATCACDAARTTIARLALSPLRTLPLPPPSPTSPSSPSPLSFAQPPMTSADAAEPPPPGTEQTLTFESTGGVVLAATVNRPHPSPSSAAPNPTPRPSPSPTLEALV